jgi:hypothetical protein
MIGNLINSKLINVLSNAYLYDRIKDICGNIKTNKKKTLQINYCLISKIVYLSKFISNAEPRFTQWVLGK